MGEKQRKLEIRKMNEEELNDLKYRQLQKLAKENGLKANLQKSALVEALLEFFEKNKDCPDSVEAEIESVPEPPQEENLDLQTENEEKVPENASNSRKNPSRKRDKSKKDSEVQNETPKEEENLDLSEESMPEKLENQSENSPKSKRNSRKRDSEPKTKVEKPSKKAKKSFDSNAFDNELAEVEQLTNDLINNIPPRKRSARNSSSVQAATSQVDDTTKTPETSEKNQQNSVKTPEVEMNESIQVSRRNSRISR